MVFALGMDISNAVALVTGANRGLGAKIAEELVSRGARVYAGARDPESVTVQGVTPVAIDTTDPATIAAAVQAAGDVTVLINNAGIARDVDLLDRRSRWGARRDGHQLLRDAGDDPRVRTGDRGQRRRRHPQRALGAVVDQLPRQRRLLRVEIRGVVHDQRGARGAARSRHHRDRAARRPDGHRYGGRIRRAQDRSGRRGPTAVDGIASGAYEVLADDVSRQVQAGLAGGVGALYPDLAG